MILIMHTEHGKFLKIHTFAIINIPGKSGMLQAACARAWQRVDFEPWWWSPA
jgi:hypothetical protein